MPDTLYETDTEEQALDGSVSQLNHDTEEKQPDTTNVQVKFVYYFAAK